MEMLTGDHAATAAVVAGPLQIGYRASLLPEDKIAIVREYQAQRHRVVMVGDGVNDAPALARADVGIAMGAAGSDIAIEAAHIALMREDWMLVPAAVRIARRTARAIRLNVGFTAGYNALGLSLAATGLLPIMLAAAAQSLPDLGIPRQLRPPAAPATSHARRDLVEEETEKCQSTRRATRLSVLHRRAVRSGDPGPSRGDTRG